MDSFERKTRHDARRRTERRRVTRNLIRTCEQLSARFVRALKVGDSDRAFRALLALSEFVDDGLAAITLDLKSCPHCRTTTQEDAS